MNFTLLKKIAFFAFIIIFSSLIFGQNSLNTTLIGRCEPMGSCSALASQGNICCVGNGTTIDVLDITDPSRPIRLGKITELGETRDIFLGGDYAYLATANGLKIVDISQPSNPVNIYADTVRNNAWGVVVKGNYVYVADNKGVFVKDIANPSKPIDAGFIDIADVCYALSVNEN
ncbi:hypothetical protein JW964_06280, partial [candidate division KSB1 bacterium]|nr:hypothetical protein [candidate division KSB1 bacterium]